ncbi:hypothetical protein CSKR_200456 [Clonorchis sinensis]|uniref:Uncharacterized protein n=1 Tax=Clonorchis sinensis TaxID=79923 RepID=A0A8T1MEK1_CLOSI|nr:hypothetical protein CSKR_200456 [Clonorchis sinensis]
MPTFRTLKAGIGHDAAAHEKVAYSQNGDRRSREHAVMVEAYQFTPNAQEVPQMLLLMDSFNSPVIKQGFDELFCLLLSRAGT